MEKIPISLYGFFIAATWIDKIAEALVGLLQFAGTISRIPSTILGLTVLSWGNSMGDLSANLAMARKGMPDMATTGCFAGPSFNLLVGTGLGFLNLQYKLGRSTAGVDHPVHTRRLLLHHRELPVDSRRRIPLWLETPTTVQSFPIRIIHIFHCIKHREGRR